MDTVTPTALPYGQQFNIKSSEQHPTGLSNIVCQCPVKVSNIIDQVGLGFSERLSLHSQKPHNE